jgi:hypothetical protein
MSSILENRRPLEVVQQSLLTVWRNDAIRVSAAVFLAARILTLVAAYVLVINTPVVRPKWMIFDPAKPRNNVSSITYDASLPPSAPLAAITAPWQRYDTAWYLKISIQGYQKDHAIVFPPLFPALVRLFVPFTGGNYVLAGLLISSICCFIFFVLLYQLIEHEFPDQVARKNGLATTTLILLAVFPTGYYLMAAYTESLFMALCLAVFLSALRREWIAAAIFTFFATLTRMQGLVLAIPLAWLALRHLWSLRKEGLQGVLRKGLITFVPVAVAPLAYGIYRGYITLNQLGTFEAAYRDEWALLTVWPTKTLLAVIDRIQRIGFTKLPDFEQLNIIMLVIFVLLALVVTFRMKLIYALYVWGNLFLILMRFHFSAKYVQLESVSRYVLVLFPCFIVAAMVLRRWGLWLLAGLASGQLQGELLNRFIHWKWVA